MYIYGLFSSKLSAIFFEKVDYQTLNLSNNQIAKKIGHKFEKLF